MRRIEIEEVANGWIVKPVISYHEQEKQDQNVYVYQTHKQLQEAIPELLKKTVTAVK